MTRASGVSDERADAMARATRQLRDHAQRRAVEIADDVLQKALQASRHSLPVRAYPPHDQVHVSDQVLVSTLRQRIDDALDTAAVGAVYLRVTPGEVLQELTVELFVRYGEVLLEVADQARAIARAVLAQVLGPPAGTIGVEVVTTHVHISDVTVGDPHLTDPRDQ